MGIEVKRNFPGYHCSRPCLEVLERHGGIDILVSIAAVNPFFGSTLDASEEVWNKALGPYSVSKTALLGLPKSLAPELGARNIRTNCLAPGIVQTKFSSALWKDEAVKEKMLKNLRVPQLGVPSDCAGIVAFLCFPDTSYISGETVVVGGGAPSCL
ncbi:dehydrogenase/reductase SDR family member 4-like [Natator depressus]|uniref:dehydrogenase/reductase SDR family member 4-like n=1 Tax=Natator depressus TaxID=27790 RepID=UPI003EB81F81